MLEGKHSVDTDGVNNRLDKAEVRISSGEVVGISCTRPGCTALGNGEVWGLPR